MRRRYKSREYLEETFFILILLVVAGYLKKHKVKLKDIQIELVYKIVAIIALITVIYIVVKHMIAIIKRKRNKDI